MSAAAIARRVSIPIDPEFARGNFELTAMDRPVYAAPGSLRVATDVVDDFVAASAERHSAERSSYRWRNVFGSAMGAVVGGFLGAAMALDHSTGKILLDTAMVAGAAAVGGEWTAGRYLLRDRSLVTVTLDGKETK
ncbi:MAG: hypothetical protein AAFY60_04705, partial [Myxococcota bacterium]